MNDEAERPVWPETVPDIGQPSELSKVHTLLEHSDQGRARNGRIAWTLAVTVLVVSIVAGVAIRGWSNATNVADQRGHAVEVLTEAYQTLTDDSVSNAKVERCQDKAFAKWIDDAIIAGQAQQGVLPRYYDRCEATNGKTFLP